MIRSSLPIVLLIFILLTGCQTGKQYHTAASMPKHMYASTRPSVKRIDLSRLARTAPNSNLIYAGDTLDVSIATGIEEEPPVWQVRVAENGVANIPQLGDMQLGGVEFNDAEQLIYSESRRQGKYVNPNVTVVLNNRKTNSVRVAGSVNSPGTYDVPVASSDLLTAIIAAGGLHDEAGTKIEIRHPTHRSRSRVVENRSGEFDGSLVSLSRPAATVSEPSGLIEVDLSSPEGVSEDLRVTDGSVIMVRQREPQTIHVMGLVKKPDQFEIPPDQEVRLLDAVAMAGGRTLQIADKVRIIRRTPQGEEVIQASINQAMKGSGDNIQLAAGDIVSVQETPATMVLGTLQSFIRVGFSAALPGI